LQLTISRYLANDQIDDRGFCQFASEEYRDLHVGRSPITSATVNWRRP
jgi:hypothetical protein